MNVGSVKATQLDVAFANPEGSFLHRRHLLGRNLHGLIFMGSAATFSSAITRRSNSQAMPGLIRMYSSVGLPIDMSFGLRRAKRWGQSHGRMHDAEDTDLVDDVS